MCVFTILALLCTSCVAVCSSGPHVEGSIHYHSSVLDQLLPQRPSLGWLANYSTHFSKTHIYRQHWGDAEGKRGYQLPRAPSWGRPLHVWTRRVNLQILTHVFVHILYFTLYYNLHFIFMWRNAWLNAAEPQTKPSQRGILIFIRDLSGKLLVRTESY